jgi:hypothetical protein
MLAQTFPGNFVLLSSPGRLIASSERIELVLQRELGMATRVRTNIEVGPLA